MNSALVPWEAFDVTHPDHADWVQKTGRCLAGEECQTHQTEGDCNVRMFDHSPWGGVSVMRTPEPPNQSLCQHAYGNQSVTVRMDMRYEDGTFEQMEGKAFKCTMCGSYLVLHDRAG